MLKHLSRRFCCVVLALGLVAAACGGDDDDDDATAGTEPTEQSTQTTGGAASDAPPLKFMFTVFEGPTFNQPESRAAVEAAVEYINNDLGGLDGRQIEVSFCPYQPDAEAAINCANTAVEEQPDVVIQAATTVSTAMLPILEGAGIPLAVAFSGEPALQNGAGATVFSLGGITGYLGFAQFAEEQGWDKVAFAALDTAGGRAGIDNFGIPAFQRAGIAAEAFYAPIGSDLTPTVAAAADGNPDAIMFVTDTPNCAAMIQAKATVGYTGDVFGLYPCNDDQQVWDVVGDAGDGFYVISPYADFGSDEDVKAYREAMEKYAPDSSIFGIAPAAFSVVMNVYRGLLTADDPAQLDAASITSTLHEAQGVREFMGNGNEYSCGQFAALSSVCSASTFVGQRKGGSLDFVTSLDISATINELMGGS